MLVSAESLEQKNKKQNVCVVFFFLHKMGQEPKVINFWCNAQIKPQKGFGALDLDSVLVLFELIPLNPGNPRPPHHNSNNLHRLK